MGEQPYKTRIVNVLLGLRMLSEAATYRYDKERSTSSKAGARVLVSLTRAGDVAEREWSLYEKHHHAMSSSRTVDELEVRLVEAEMALRAARVRDVGGGTGRMSPGERRLWVLRQVGRSAAEVAVEAGMSVHWVRRIRERGGQEPKHGGDAA